MNINKIKTEQVIYSPDDVIELVKANARKQLGLALDAVVEVETNFKFEIVATHKVVIPNSSIKPELGAND